MIGFGLSIDIEWIARSAFHLGWPGLLIGIAIGLMAWRDRRLVGTLLGGFFELSVWAAMNAAYF